MYIMCSERVFVFVYVMPTAAVMFTCFRLCPVTLTLGVAPTLWQYRGRTIQVAVLKSLSFVSLQAEYITPNSVATVFIFSLLT